MVHFFIVPARLRDEISEFQLLYWAETHTRWFFSFCFETCTARYLPNFPHDWSSLTTNLESANSLYTNCPLAVKSISESRLFYFRFHAHNNRTTVSLQKSHYVWRHFQGIVSICKMLIATPTPGRLHLINDKDTQNLHLKIIQRTINRTDLKVFTMNWFIL